MKVLIVEDNLDDRGILRAILESHGWETVEAGDGIEALDQARQHRPGLIISDALMPRMDGFQFLRVIKMHPEFKDVPFIFYSAVYTGYKEEELALSLGAEAFIVKPREPQELWCDITAIMHAHGRGEKQPTGGELTRNDEEFIMKYGEVVTTKIEEKIKELEDALARRKAAEEALRCQFTVISTIFDELNAAVFLSDLEEGRLLFSNRQGSFLFGDHWEGKRWKDVLAGAGIAIPGERPGENGVRQNSSWEFEDTRSRKWYLCLDRVIPWADGSRARLTIAIDNTERKEVERVKDEMVSAVSHEMRTPLTAMLGFSALILENEVPTEQQREYLQIIHNETEKLSELIGDFLSLQRLQSHEARMEKFVPVDMCPIVQEIALRYRVFSEKHRLVVDCPPEIPPIMGNPRDLKTMLDNLVSNAIKFSPDGGPVAIKVRQDETEATITVEDHGIGIQSHIVGKIFDRFYQADSSDSRRFQGTGLGLALVREVVSCHGGRVGVESTVGKGTIFHVSLPFRHEKGHE